MPSLTLVSNKICPFAHRAWLTLEELGAAYEFKEASIAPGTKPAWFTEVYQRAMGAAPGSDGKVPVLVETREGGAPDLVLAESGVIAEYVAESFGAASGLLPATPLERAETSLFVSQQVGAFTGAFYPLLMAQDDESKAKHAKALLAACESISHVYGRHGGPYLLGQRLTLGDIMLWPFVERLCVVEHYRGFRVPDEPAFANFHAFNAAMRGRETVKKCLQDPAFFVEGYAGYANPVKAA